VLVTQYARDYALALLSDIDSEGLKEKLSQFNFDHPANGWRRSGLMSLTGTANGRPLMSPAPLTACADGALAALQILVNESNPNFSFDFRGATLLSERARLMELDRAGEIAPGGSCRLLQAADGLLAVNLPRDEDWSSVPAWLETPIANWEKLADVLSERTVEVLLDRARLLSLAVARADIVPEVATAYCPNHLLDQRRAENLLPPLVIDLSTLWAGPLAGSLLQAVGARVIKVESNQREDGARRGHRGFFELLNSTKESLVLDLSTTAGRATLEHLILQADIVIESARPRALEQMGIVAADCIEKNPTLVWASITAYGRSGDHAQRIGFGDDVILDIPMYRVTRQCANFAGDVFAHAELQARVKRWYALALADQRPEYELRRTSDNSPEIGAHSNSLLREFGVAC